MKLTNQWSPFDSAKGAELVLQDLKLNNGIIVKECYPHGRQFKHNDPNCPVPVIPFSVVSAAKLNPKSKQ